MRTRRLFAGSRSLVEAGFHPRRLGGRANSNPSRRRVDERASSHEGYNQRPGPVGGWASDAGIEPVKDASEAIGLRAGEWLGPGDAPLIVSGGSHAGNTAGIPESNASPRATAST